METLRLNGFDPQEWLLQTLQDHRDQILAEIRTQAKSVLDQADNTDIAKMSEVSQLSHGTAPTKQVCFKANGVKANSELPKPAFVKPSAFSDSQVPTPWPSNGKVGSNGLAQETSSCTTPERKSSMKPGSDNGKASHVSHVRMDSSVLELDDDGNSCAKKLNNLHSAEDMSSEMADSASPCAQAVERKFHYCRTTSDIFKSTYSKSGWKQSRAHMKSRITELSSQAEKQMSEYISQNLFQRQPHKLRKFDYCVAVLIGLNALVMLVQLQWEGHRTAVALGLQADDGSWAHAKVVFKILEHLFNVAFFVELVIRIKIVRKKYFREFSNIADALLVIGCSVNLYVLEPLGDSDSQLSILGVLRLGRTIRVLRVTRVLKMFQELRILVTTFLSSLFSLIWAMVLIFLVILIAGLFVSFSIQDFMRDESNNHSTRLFLYHHYRNGFHAMYALFEATMSGCWPTYFRPLIDHVSVWYVVFVCLYVSIVIFALTRVITAMFLKETLRITQGDAEVQAAEQFKKKHGLIDRLRNMFYAIDTSGDGRLNYSEFKRMCTNPEVQVILRMLELDIEDADEVFNILDSQQVGEIGFEDFLKGVQRLKGQARSLDMIAIMITTDAMHHALDDVHKRVFKMERLIMTMMEESLEPDSPMKKERALSMWK